MDTNTSPVELGPYPWKTIKAGEAFIMHANSRSSVTRQGRRYGKAFAARTNKDGTVTVYCVSDLAGIEPDRGPAQPPELMHSPRVLCRPAVVAGAQENTASTGVAVYSIGNVRVEITMPTSEPQRIEDVAKWIMEAILNRPAVAEAHWRHGQIVLEAYRALAQWDGCMVPDALSRSHRDVGEALNQPWQFVPNDAKAREEIK